MKLKLRLRSDQIIELANKHDCALFHGEDMRTGFRSTLLGLGYMVSGNRVASPTDALLDRGIVAMAINVTNDHHFIDYVKRLSKKYDYRYLVIREGGKTEARMYKVQEDEYGAESECFNLENGHQFCGAEERIRRISGALTFTDATSYNLMTRGYFFEKYKREFLEELKELKK